VVTSVWQREGNRNCPKNVKIIETYLQDYSLEIPQGALFDRTIRFMTEIYFAAIFLNFLSINQSINQSIKVTFIRRNFHFKKQMFKCAPYVEFLKCFLKRCVFRQSVPELIERVSKSDRSFPFHFVFWLLFLSNVNILNMSTFCMFLTGWAGLLLPLMSKLTIEDESGKLGLLLKLCLLQIFIEACWSHRPIWWQKLVHLQLLSLKLDFRLIYHHCHRYRVFEKNVPWAVLLFSCSSILQLQFCCSICSIAVLLFNSSSIVQLQFCCSWDIF
jgi:hypothetical protein